MTVEVTYRSEARGGIMGGIMGIILLMILILLVAGALPTLAITWWHRSHGRD